MFWSQYKLHCLSHNYPETDEEMSPNIRLYLVTCASSTTHHSTLIKAHTDSELIFEKYNNFPILRNTLQVFEI